MHRPFLTLLLSLPLGLAAAQLPQVADFSAGRWDLAGFSAGQSGIQTDFGRDDEGSFLSVSGAGGSLSLPLAGGAASSLDLRQHPYSRSVVLEWRAAAGAQIDLGLVDAQGREHSVLLSASDGAWHESAVGYLGGPGAAALSWSGDSMPATAVRIRLVGAAAVDIRGVRLDPPAASISVTQAVQVFGGDPVQVRRLRRLGLPEDLTWMLQRIQQACGCDAAQLGRERATLSWGGIAQAHGLDWKSLVADVEARRDAAGLRTPAASDWQQLRSWTNADLSEVLP